MSDWLKFQAGFDVHGDSKMTLYRARTGQEVIETNGDPCWDSEDGFSAA